MTDRFKQKIYFTQILTYRDGYWGYHKSGNGTLFTAKHQRTKIYAEDVPEWYLFGRFYKQWGYITTKGVTDMVYVPNHFTNHFLKDDFLLISYGGKIEPIAGMEKKSVFERFIGFDEVLWNNEIIGFLKGARQYSGYDISAFISQLREKLVWLRNMYPNEFNEETWKYDVDEVFAKEFCNCHPAKYYALTLDDYSCPSCCSGSKRYYGTLSDIDIFMSKLDPDRFKNTLGAWAQYKNGKLDVSHNVAYNQKILIEPVRLIDDAFTEKQEYEWEFFNAYECSYTMRLDDSTIQVILIRDGEDIIRCIRPHIINLRYQDDLNNSASWHRLDGTFWGHPGMLTINDNREKTIIASVLYLPEKRYDNLQTACNELYKNDISLNPICWEVFGDG